MPKTAEEKAANRFNKKLQLFKCYGLTKCISKYVAPTFQKMIRAEAGAFVGQVWFYKNDGLYTSWSTLGECRCVTCGVALPWAGVRGELQLCCGHFVSRSVRITLLDEMNVAPQCSRCNGFGNGMRAEFREWLDYVRPGEADRLEAIKNEKKFYDKPELAQFTLDCAARTKAAIKVMGQ